MNKLIFLDIDGVVNTLIIGDKPFDNSGYGHINRDGFYYDLCGTEDGRVSNKQAVLWLNKLCKDSGAKIVISSTWRFCERIFTTEQCLRNTGLLPEIEIIGKTPRIPHGCRGDEIAEYIRINYPNGVDAFVILDDDADMGDLIDHLVQCHVDHGFGAPEYRKALEILKVDF